MTTKTVNHASDRTCYSGVLKNGARAAEHWEIGHRPHVDLHLRARGEIQGLVANAASEANVNLHWVNIRGCRVF